MKTVLTGIKSTGNGLHIGNYFGAFKPLMEAGKGNKTYIFIADYHSLTTVHSGEEMTRNKKRLLREYFSLLPENSDIVVFEQSKVKRINDITWILSSVTPLSLMFRAHVYKDAVAKGKELNLATFNYPALMAADIISYDTDIVPVGKDQIQHVEFARDIAEYFNKTYNTELFKLPIAYVDENVATIPGLDGRKMSKSYDNFLGIFDDEKIIKKKIMGIVTGSETLEEAKDPEKCNVFALIKMFASIEKQEEIAKKYRAGNYGYGHAKEELYNAFLEYFKIPREKYKKFETDMSYIDKKLEEGNKEANALADKKYEEMIKLTGL